MDRSVYDRMKRLEAQHWWFCARRLLLASVIKRTLASGSHHMILEAGCGTGGNLAMLRQFGHVDAFEYDDAARQHAAEKSGLDVRSGKLPYDVPFEGKTYDLIGLFDVLEHVLEDSASLDSLAKRLNPSGKIIATVPAYPGLWSVHDDRHHHVRRYTQASLTKAVQNAGLEMSYCSYFNTFLLPLAIAVRTAKRHTGRQTADDALPPDSINRSLTSIFGLERWLLGRIRLPWGLSLIAVVTKTRGRCYDN